MKNIFKIKIHPLFYVIAFLTIITGFFKDFTYIMLIICVHEFGHIVVALYFKWNIDRIVILPFGGITIFNEKINQPIKEELLIALSGPFLQLLVFSFFKSELILKYHYFLLFFNLLPIVPLDGSKICNLCLNKIIPFKYSHIITILISSILVLFIFFTSFNLVTLIIFIFLIFKIGEEYYNHNNLVNKFLIERYLYKLNFNKRKEIKSINNMFRDYKHVFNINNKYYSERDILRKRFDN